MRKLITGMKLSLDGKIEGAEGYADWAGPAEEARAFSGPPRRNSSERS